MPFLEWSDTFRTGVESIDEEHRRIFQVINALHDHTKPGASSIRAQEAMDALLWYGSEHFQNEEALMKYLGYPGYQEHQHEHQALKEALLKLREDGFDLHAIAEFSRSWITLHIKTQDLRFIHWVRHREGSG